MREEGQEDGGEEELSNKLISKRDEVKEVIINNLIKIPNLEEINSGLNKKKDP